AIDRVIQQAGPRDVILIAGKGHERFQEIQGQRISFDDESRAREALQLHWSLQVQA
ncbi:MAG: UDP-N-acetylmuramoyl-L-alanyl-D-glutamate--2,6-diaminopimelate ligase, partial [Betaproteobacteria bacterium]|nr:UDP-N-acetylmuramoyl-L-alanyl-D-glutamate--2,6-diaminopimelate ligase [Betaproteobacteria bacterium]